MHLCPKKSFKINIVDLYIWIPGDKATGEQNFQLFEDLCNDC